MRVVFCNYTNYFSQVYSLFVLFIYFLLTCNQKIFSFLLCFHSRKMCAYIFYVMISTENSVITAFLVHVHERYRDKTFLNFWTISYVILSETWHFSRDAPKHFYDFLTNTTGYPFIRDQLRYKLPIKTPSQVSDLPRKLDSQIKSLYNVNSLWIFDELSV